AGARRLARPLAWPRRRLDRRTRLPGPRAADVPRAVGGVVMSQAREAFLSRVHQAVAAGNQAGDATPLPARDGVGYQGAGDDPVLRFQEQLQAAGGVFHFVSYRREAAALVLELVAGHAAREILLGRSELLDSLKLSERLGERGVEVTAVDQLAGETARATLFAADVGISGVDALIAETGTVVLRARPREPRSLSLLPPVHIVVAAREQVVADLFDRCEGPPGDVPSCLSLITGPSKTGDIELRLVTGVHGPGELHVVLVGE